MKLPRGNQLSEFLATIKCNTFFTDEVLEQILTAPPTNQAVCPWNESCVTAQGGSNLHNLNHRRRLARNYQPHPSATGRQELQQVVWPGNTLLFA